MRAKRYNDENVLDAARKRISYIFDEFETIIVSISGGKDSTVTAHLALEEAHRRGRRIGLFYLDEEVVYQATIEQVEYLMSLYPENTTRYWLQIPFHLTNSTSYVDSQLDAWEPEKRKLWMHPKRENNIRVRCWSHETRIADKVKGFGFYDLLYNFEMTFHNAAFICGLRADESLNRYRTMIKNPGYKDVMWSTKRACHNVTFYPIYDWAFSDVWKYIGDAGIRYHAYYDYAFKKGVPAHAMRVSSLTHEHAFKSIQDLPEFEFKTYERLLKRIKGISFAQETARNKKAFSVQKLPKAFKTWREYRDNLLATFPDAEKKAIFERRFSHHLENEYVARQQCRQLFLNDYENNLPIKNTEDPKDIRIAYWREVL